MDSDYSHATDAFRSGDYQTAIVYFSRALESSSHPSFQLYYNLGVSFYRIQDYAQSEQAFYRVLENKDMAALAAYNLGLVKNKQGDEAGAIVWFRESYDLTTDQGLQSLALQALAQLEDDLTYSPPTSRFTLASVSYGYENNIVDPVEFVSDSSDRFLEAYGVYRHELSDLVSITGMLFAKEYQSFKEYSLKSWSVRLDKSFKLDSWILTASPMFASYTLGGVHLFDETGLELEARYYIADQDLLEFRIRHENIQSPKRRYLEGDTQNIYVDYRAKRGLFDNRYGYRLELNQRTDSDDASYSPIRHGVSYKLSYNTGQKLSGSALLLHRRSYYPEANGLSRKDRFSSLAFQLEYDLGSSFKIIGKYRHAINQSNDVYKDYARDTVSIGMSAIF